MLFFFFFQRIFVFQNTTLKFFSFLRKRKILVFKLEIQYIQNTSKTNMKCTNKNTTIEVPSMESDEMSQITFMMEQSCSIVNEMQSEELKPEQKKEIVQMAEDKEGGIETGINSLTVIGDALGNVEVLRKMMIEVLQKKLSTVSKKLLESVKDPERREELEKEVIVSNGCDVPNLNGDQVKQLEEWTGLECGEILFDSTVDNWSKETTVFNERILGKKQLSFLIEDEDGEKFGYYLNTEVIEKYGYYQETDSKSFKFNLQSKNEKNQSHCYQSEDTFDYHGIENALCGKPGYMHFFTPKRILVIQMK